MVRGKFSETLQIQLRTTESEKKKQQRSVERKERVEKNREKFGIIFREERRRVASTRFSIGANLTLVRGEEGWRDSRLGSRAEEKPRVAKADTIETDPLI